MSVLFIHGNARDELARLPRASVHTCVTSPPYWGLRHYNTQPQVWGGKKRCEHDWGLPVRAPWANDLAGPASVKTSFNVGANYQRGKSSGRWCQRCKAWEGELGNEPTPELYIKHLVMIFDLVQPVLHESGTLWVNLGDAFSGSGKGPGNKFSATTSIKGSVDQDVRQGFHSQGREVPEGTKAKDLLLLPEQFVLAMRRRGWWVRAKMPWIKRNAMPESVKDRPATAMEWIFLFSKSHRYFYDVHAARVTQTGNAHGRGRGMTPKARLAARGGHHEVKANESFHAATSAVVKLPAGRARRNTDWFFDTFQGLVANEVGDPLALVVNPRPFKGAHFARFPDRLVEPMLVSSISEWGVCPDCLEPWERVVRRTGKDQRPVNKSKRAKAASHERLSTRWANTTQAEGGDVYRAWRSDNPGLQLGWRPRCRCYDERYRSASTLFPVPRNAEKARRRSLWKGRWKRVRARPGDPTWPVVTGKALDIFGGAGTTATVADRHGYEAVSIELNAKYHQMAQEELIKDREVRKLADPLTVAAEAGQILLDGLQPLMFDEVVAR